MILADEVGLGKTIEAGLVIAQRWAEHKRKILMEQAADLLGIKPKHFAGFEQLVLKGAAA